MQLLLDNFQERTKLTGLGLVGAMSCDDADAGACYRDFQVEEPWRLSQDFNVMFVNMHRAPTAFKKSTLAVYPDRCAPPGQRIGPQFQVLLGHGDTCGSLGLLERNNVEVSCIKLGFDVGSTTSIALNIECAKVHLKANSSICRRQACSCLDRYQLSVA